MYNKIARLLAGILNLYEEDITADMPLTPEFEVEKIHLAKLVIECEKLFKVTIHDEAVHSFRTINDIINHIENALAANDGHIREGTEEERLWWYYV